MNNKKKIEDLEHLKNNYIMLKNLIIHYQYAINFNEKLDKEKENVKTKTLVLTKKFYGKDLVVG